MKRISYALIGLAGLVSLAGAAMAETIGFATLPQGSLFHTMGSVMAKVAKQKAGLKMLVQPHSGTAAGVAVIDTGEADFTVLDVNEGIFAAAGLDAYKGRAKKNIRVVMKVRAVPVGIMVRLDSGIKTLADMKGRRYPSGWQAFPNGKALSRGVFATAGMSFDDVKGVPTPDLIRAADDFVAGKVDGTLFAIGAPKVAQVNAAVGGIRFIPIANTKAALAAMRKIRPAYYIVPIKPAKYLPGVVGVTPMLTWDMVIFAGKHVKDETVYNFVKAMHGSKKELAKALPVFNTFFPKQMATQYEGLKPHPGAVKFYKEAGLMK